MTLKKSIYGALFALASTSTFAATQIDFWHSMDGELGRKVNQIVDDFNKQHPDYDIKATYKGGYNDSMNAAIAAFRSGHSPDVVQVFEVGTATMMFTKGVIEPIQALSEKVNNPIDEKKFVGGIAGYYSDANGKLVSMPFNSSTAVLYYNKDMFQKAGLDPEKAPQTFEDIREMGKKLKAAGTECVYTTSWPTWVLVENFAAVNNELYATEKNGFASLKTELKLDSEGFRQHFQNLQDMANEGTFTYGGRGSAATSLFSSGKCAIFTGSSGSRADLDKSAQFKFGVAKLPHYAKNKPLNTIIGGASLWVFSNKSDAKYKGIIEFFHYLSSPEVAADWHQSTGYVPVVKAAYDLSKEQGFYEKKPGADIPFKSLDVEETTDASKGVRLGFLPQIRDIEEGQLEELLSNKTTVDEMVKTINQKANKLLRNFEKANK
ncbi:MAG: sn-glycerol-3-phosphate ABC transporter substrate-binding protein UgpB [Alcaligenaceae bacterium]|nr:sn-glycerol-3-phosphate ABC transporter substrate-binding protein UgpB [Alcaligenaceae bacterium]